MLFRLVFLGVLSEPIVVGVFIFRRFPIEIDEEGEKYRPPDVSSAALATSDVSRRLSLHGDSRSPLPERR